MFMRGFCSLLSEPRHQGLLSREGTPGSRATMLRGYQETVKEETALGASSDAQAVEKELPRVPGRQQGPIRAGGGAPGSAFTYK